MAKANLSKSLVVGNLLPREHGYSFLNAYKTVILMPPRAFYVEGFTVHHGLVFEHAWIELDGEIIEPASAWRQKDDVEYFAGIRYSRSEAIELHEELHGLPFAWMDGNWGLTDPAYQRAAGEAAAYSRSVKSASW